MTSRSYLPSPQAFQVLCRCSHLRFRFLEFGRIHRDQRLRPRQRQRQRQWSGLLLASFSPLGLCDISAMADRYPREAAIAIRIRIRIRIRLRRGITIVGTSVYPSCHSLPTQNERTNLALSPGLRSLAGLGRVDRYERG